MCQLVPNFLSYVSVRYFQLVYSWESYRKNKKDEFVETQCSNAVFVDCATTYYCNLYIFSTTCITNAG